MRSNCWPATPISAGCVRWSASCVPRCCRARASRTRSPRHPALFPPMYVALVRVGEVSGHARSGARDAGRRAGAIRSRCAASSPMRCSTRLSCWSRRSASCCSSSVRAAAILIRAAGFRQQVRYGAQRLHQAVGLSSRPTPPPRLLARPPRSRRGWLAVAARRHAFRDRGAAVASARHRHGAFDSIAPACFAAISASCSAAGSTSRRPCASSSTSWR